MSTSETKLHSKTDTTETGEKSGMRPEIIAVIVVVALLFLGVIITVLILSLSGSGSPQTSPPTPKNVSEADQRSQEDVQMKSGSNVQVNNQQQNQPPSSVVISSINTSESEIDDLVSNSTLGRNVDPIYGIDPSQIKTTFGKPTFPGFE